MECKCGNTLLGYKIYICELSIVCRGKVMCKYCYVRHREKYHKDF